MTTTITHQTEVSAAAPTNMQNLGRELVTRLHVMLRTCRIHSPDNESFRQQLQKFNDGLIEAFRSVDYVAITAAEGYLFLNEERIKTNLDNYLAAKNLQESFGSYKIAGFRFDNGISMPTLNKLFTLLSELRPVENSDDSIDLDKRVSEISLPSFSLVPLMRLSTSRSKVRTIREKKLLARKSFVGAISAVEDIVSQSASNTPVRVSRVKRIVHSLVDQILDDETYLIELTALKDFDDYTFVHSVSVCIYSIALGFRLGFTRPMLAEIGFSAMFHDIGKTKIPVDLLNKPSKLQGSDWDIVHEHPVFGAKMLGETMNLDRYTARAILVSFEHHKNLDGSGYPYINRTEKVNLFSRIVAICDYFDAITSHRKYQKKKGRLDEAVKEILKHSGTKFEPPLVKAFVNVIGVYPAGSLLLLDTDELAIVISNDPENIFRPRVRVVADRTGRLPQSRVIDLSDRELDSEKFVRNVVRVVDPQKYNIDITRFVLAD